MTKHFLNIPAVYRIGTRWIGSLPLALSYFISQSIADLSYVCYRSAVRNVKQNLRLVFPDISEGDLSAIVVRLFRNYSKCLVDYGRFTHLDRHDILKRIASVEGRDNLDAALQMNKGVILLGVHLGNWELGGIFLSSYGLKTNVITNKDTDSEIDAMRKWYRELHNVSSITIGDSPFSAIEAVNALCNQEIIAMLIDRYNGSADSITTNLFNKPALFPTGPFTLSRLTGAPIVVAFVVRDGQGYKAIIEHPITVTSKENEYETLRKVVNIIEKYVRIYPDQWYNFVPI